MYKVTYAINEAGATIQEKSPFTGERFEDLYEKFIMSPTREIRLEVKWSHHNRAKLSEKEINPDNFVNYYDSRYSNTRLYPLTPDDVTKLYVTKNVKLNKENCHTEVIPDTDLANIIVTRDLTGDSDFEFGYVTCDKLTLDIKVTPNYEMFLNEYDELSLVSYLTVYDDFKHVYTIPVPIGTFLVADIERTDMKYSLTCYDYFYWSNVIPTENKDKPNTDYKNIDHIMLHDLVLNRYNKNFNVLGDINKTGIINLFGSLANASVVPDRLKSNIPDVTVEFLEEELLVRNFWGFVAGLRGSYIRADKTGINNNKYRTERESSFVIYEETPKVYNASQYGEFSKKNYDMKITRLECTSVSSTHNPNANTDEDKYLIEEMVYTSNPNGIDVYSFSNPLMTQTELNIVLAKYTSYNSYKGFAYTPISCKIIGDPRLDIADIITLRSQERPNKETREIVEREYKLPIMLQTIYFRNCKSCTMTVESISDKYRKREAYTGLTVQEQINNIANKLSSVEGQVYAEPSTEGEVNDETLVSRVEKLESAVGTDGSGDTSGGSISWRVRNLENEIAVIEGTIGEWEDEIAGNATRITDIERVVNGYTIDNWGNDFHVPGLIDKVETNTDAIDVLEDTVLYKEEAITLYSPIGHTHKLSDIEGLDIPEIPDIPDTSELENRVQQIENTLPNKSDVGHTHTVSQITDLVIPDTSELSSKVSELEERISALETPEDEIDPDFGKSYILPSQCEGIMERTSLDTDFILDSDFPIENPIYLKVIKASDTIILIDVVFVNEESIITTNRYSLIDGIYTLL